MLSADLVARLAQLANRGPRDTSYPPATEFGAMPLEQVVRNVCMVFDRYNQRAERPAMGYSPTI